MAGTTKRTTKRKSPPRETKSAQQAKKQMWAVVLFAVGLLMIALTFVEGKNIWWALHTFLFGMFGWSVYFLGPLMIYIAVMAAKDRPLTAIKAKLWQALILIVIISGAIQIFGVGVPDGDSLADNLYLLYQGGRELRGGGVAGAIFAVPLITLCGKLGAVIIIFICIFLFTMLITGSTLLGLFDTAKKPVKELEEAYADAVETRKERQKSKRPAPKKVDKPQKPAAVGTFNFDVDISGDTDPVVEELEEIPLPQHPVISPKEPEKNPPYADSPVEYITAAEFSMAPPQPVQPREPAAKPKGRSHPLDEEIRMAEQKDQGEIGMLVDRFLETSGGSFGFAVEGPAEQLKNLESIVSSGMDPTQMAAQPPVPTIPVEGAGQSIVNDSIPNGFSMAAGTGEAPVPTIPVEEVADPLIPTIPVDFQKTAGAPVPTIPVEDPLPITPDYTKPPLNLLKAPKGASGEDISEELKNNAQTLVDTLKSFGVQTRIIDICRGPAVTRYELQPSAGVKISKITGLADDIALNLASAGIRIEAPIPGKPAVGIEVPNKVVSTVSIREIIDSKEFRQADSSVTVSLGKDIAGNITTADIAKMPHVLIAGATGSGKSVCINSIIVSLLYKSSPEEVKLLMVDPKVVELGIYNGIPHLLVPVVTDPKKAAGALGWAVKEMLDRYKAFAANSVRDINGYNKLAKHSDDPNLQPMPQIVIIIDELADLMMAAPGEVEDAICRLAQMARAAGMHLVIATQRPSVDVITGVIKANIPSRIAFAVSSQVDSRTILDMGGAEKLLGRGDMLFYPVGAAKPQRVQGCFVTDAEVEKVVDYVKGGENATYDQNIAEEIERHTVADKNSKDKGGGFDAEDDMLPQAIECVVEMGQASTSALQRRLKLGYARAARIIDQLEERGIVGPFEGSKPRQVLISKERWMEMKLSGAEDAQINLSQQQNGTAPTFEFVQPDLEE